MANDLGVIILGILLTTEAGVFLLGVLLASLVKYFWRSRIADELRQQFEGKKFIIYMLISLMGVILFIIQSNNIVKNVGIALVGIGLSSILMDMWEDYIYPFISHNTSRVAVSVVAFFLFAFAGTIDELISFPTLFTIIFAIIILLAMWKKELLILFPPIAGLIMQIKAYYEQRHLVEEKL